jgi:Ca2+-binding EF-hand superfamily protein
VNEIERILSVPPAVLGLVDEKKPRAPWPLEIPRREFARVDADRSGFLAGDETAGAVGQADEDGDGRVSFREYALWSKALSTGPFTTGMAPEGPRFKATRVDPDGDITRLLDMVDPARFDKDDDARLSRAEMDAAWFAALDLDGDHALTSAELSRRPGNTRRIRYGGAQSEKTFASFDLDASGKVGLAELHVPDEEWELLDPNKDGFVQLRIKPGTRASKSGRPEMTIEWPARRGYTVPLPPGTKPETVLAVLDKDGDKILSRRELEKRPDLLYERDVDGSGVIEANELKIACDILSVTGVDFVRDGFIERWDLDGDGKVDAGELSVVPWIRSRLGL